MKWEAFRMGKADTWRERLPVRLLLFVVVPLTLAQVGVATVVHWLLEERVEQRMQEDVELIARALQRPVSDALATGEGQRVLSVLSASFDFRRVYGASIYDHAGNIVAVSGGTDWQRRAPTGPLRRKGGGQYESINGEDVYSYYVPVWLDPAGRRGMLRVTRTKAEIDRFLTRLRSWTLGIVLFGAIVTTAIVFLGHYVAIGRALGRFRSAILRIQDGDQSHRATVSGPHEVRNIIGSFNGMMDSIERAQGVLSQEREKKARLVVQLVHAEKMASIGRIAGGIAHELGSPLGTVSGRLQRVLRNPSVPDEARRELDKLDDEVVHMTRIVSEVLDFARADARNKKQVELSRLVRSVASSCRSSNGDGCAVEVDCPSTNLWVFAEPSRLELAFSNLVRNAQDVTPPSGRVRIRVRQQDELVYVSVVDEGPGIAESVRETLFEPFVTTKHGRGTGLGLPIAQAIVRQHGGEVEARSGEGGSSFDVALPLMELSEKAFRRSAKESS